MSGFSESERVGTPITRARVEGSTAIERAAFVVKFEVVFLPALLLFIERKSINDAEGGRVGVRLVIPIGRFSSHPIVVVSRSAAVECHDRDAHECKRASGSECAHQLETVG